MLHSREEIEKKAVWDIITAVFGMWILVESCSEAMVFADTCKEFVASIAMLCVGDPKEPNVDKIVETVEKAKKTGEAGARLSSETPKKLFEVADTIYKLYPTMDKAVKSLEILLKKPRIDVDKISDIAGGAGDATATVTLAAWDEEKKIDEDAEAKFYDRFMTIRTSIVIQMRDVVWAYKFETPSDSKITLSVQKTAAEYEQDLATVAGELNGYLVSHPNGVSSKSPLSLWK